MFESLSNNIVAGLFMTALGMSLALLLAVANRRLFVYEDPRIDTIDDMLPHSNCGACGTAGCRAFAEALIAGAAQPGQCSVNSRAENEAIAEFLGVDVGEEEKRVARLACAGGNNVAWHQAHYDGLATCRAAALVSGGGKSCSWGCLGLGDCETSCEFDAISMDAHGLPQVESEKCTACGDCVDVCPKQLFSLQPVSHRLWVACKNLEFGELAERQCEVACNACGRCVADAAEDLIQIKDNLARINYNNNDRASRVPIERCPTGAIVWFSTVDVYNRGVGARQILRHETLPIKRSA